MSAKKLAGPRLKLEVEQDFSSGCHVTDALHLLLLYPALFLHFCLPPAAAAAAATTILRLDSPLSVRLCHEETENDPDEERR